MSPFAHHFYELRSRHRISQFALAKLMGYAQGFLSSLELGKKLPTDEFLDKLIEVLQLNPVDAEALRQSAKESQRRYALAESASAEQFRLVYNLWNKLDQLQPGQMRMIEEVLNFQSDLSVRTQQNQYPIKQGGHM